MTFTRRASQLKSSEAQSAEAKLPSLLGGGRRYEQITFSFILYYEWYTSNQQRRYC